MAKSFADEIDPPTKGALYEASQKNLSQQFDRARQAQLEKQQPSAANQSGPKAPELKPEMHLRPGGELQRSVDGPIHNQQLRDAAKHAKEINDAAKARESAQKQTELKNDPNKDPNKDPDRER